MPEKHRLDAVLRQGQPVFGPALDALIRRIEPRLAPADRPDFETLLQGWPFAAPGLPDRAEALFQRLVALDARLGAPPGRRRGSSGSALAGLVLGGILGLPVGLVFYFLAREAVLPTELWSLDSIMWAMVIPVMLGGAAIGAKQAAHPTRGGHALRSGLLGFLVGAVLCGVAAAVLAMVVGEMSGVSQREGAFAMAVFFFIMPSGGLIGGLGFAAWWATRAWRRWAS